MKTKERVKAGIKRIYEKPIFLLIPLLYVIVLGFITHRELGILKILFLKYTFIFMIIVLALVGICFIVKIIGTPIKSKKIEKALLNIGFIDNSGDSPMLLSQKKSKNGTILEFYSKMIPLSEYEKHKEKIETALNLKIISISRGKDVRHVIIKAINSLTGNEDIIYWNDKYLSEKDFELVLGESYFEIESIDITVTPHILIGGGTGSGKSKLLKLILIESIKKGAKIFLADFKGGIDYPSVWHKQCKIITEQKELDSQLSIILETMEERRHMLVESETPNIKEYNEKTDSNLPRIIIACDEIAEVLDKTGLNKNEKELVNKIESKMSTIARQGRAFGIHLIFATQRPDSEILKGQIKNNISYRVCGRADKILSQIILDTPECANIISPNDQGMFLTNTGVLFKSYYIEDNCL